MNTPDDRTLLAADVSDPLLACLEAGDLSLGAVKVGPWFSPEQIAAFRQKMPGLVFLFHASNLVCELGVMDGIRDRFGAYLQAASSPWVSVHLSVWEPDALRQLRAGKVPPLPDPRGAMDRLLWKVDQLRQITTLPILIENIEPLPHAGYDYWSRPDYIIQALERSGCGFLLDTGHLRVSTDRFGMTEAAYLDGLPLDRIMEIHVSGPRRKNGRLFDAHATLMAEDYRLCESLLGRTHPRALTLEYIRNSRDLRKQLTRLGGILNGRGGKGAVK